MHAMLLILSLIPAQDAGKRTWQVDGAQREAIVRTPAKKSGKPPLVFVFHGHGGTMQHSERRMNMHDLWPEAVVVYPQGLPTKGQLTDPEGKKPGWQSMKGNESDRDLKFFDAMLETMMKDYNADPNRVYVTGHSNGGSFSYLLWQQRHDKLAAAAPSGAAGRNAQGLKPLPAIHFAGEKDPLVKFEWQERTMDLARTANNCDKEPKDWADKCKLYPSKSGTPYVVYTHPGGHEYPREAPALTVKFFKEHVRQTARP